MKALHFDAATGGEVPARIAQTGGLSGFTSWRRLSDIFRDAGEVREGERLTSFQVDARGIVFYVERR